VRQNSIQVNEDSKKTDMYQLVSDKDCVVLRAPKDIQCTFSTETNDQEVSEANHLDLTVEEQIKATDKESNNDEKGDQFDDPCERTNNLRLKERIPNDVVIRRSARSKRLKSDKSDDFL
jgi:hypothetical protein